MKSKIVFWIPRIIVILAIMFVSMFALDSFTPEKNIWQQLLEFLIHLLPSYILLIVLLIAWKFELTGGILFIIISVGFIPFIYLHNYQMNHSVWISMSIIMMINFPFLLAGILFVWSYIINKKLKQK